LVKSKMLHPTPKIESHETDRGTRSAPSHEKTICGDAEIGWAHNRVDINGSIGLQAVQRYPYSEPRWSGRLNDGVARQPWRTSGARNRSRGGLEKQAPSSRDRLINVSCGSIPSGVGMTGGA